MKHISPFVLDRCDIAVFDPLAWEIYYDLRTLVDLEAELSKEGGTSDKTWAGELLYELNRFANAFDIEDRSTWKKSHAIVKKLYARHNATANPRAVRHRPRTHRHGVALAAGGNGSQV